MKRSLPGIVTLLTVLLINSPAATQSMTKDSCSALARALAPATIMLSDFSKAAAAIDWNMLSGTTSAQVKSSIENAKRAQADFVATAEKYRAALEDVTYQAQLCAR